MNERTCSKGHTDLRKRKGRRNSFLCRTCRKLRENTGIISLELSLPKPEIHTSSVAETATPRRLLIAPDIHYPVHHERAVNAFLDFADEVKPDLLVQLGDLFDVHGISSFLKDPKRLLRPGGTLHDEVRSAEPFWARTAKSCKQRKWIMGNHEFRVEREIVYANPALFAHPALGARSIFQVPEDVEIHDHETKLRVGNITISHGHMLRGSGAKYSAANVLNNYPNEVNVYGHTHRIDSCRRTTGNADRRRTYAAFNIGYLGDAYKIGHAVDPNWQLGFAYVEFYEVDGRTRFTFHQIEMVDGRFSFNGRVYG